MVDRLTRRRGSRLSGSVTAAFIASAGSSRFVEMKQHFVVRLKRDVTVHLRDRVCLLKSLEISEGQRRPDLGSSTLRADEARASPPHRGLGQRGERGLVAGD